MAEKTELLWLLSLSLFFGGSSHEVSTRLSIDSILTKNWQSCSQVYIGTLPKSIEVTSIDSFRLTEGHLQANGTVSLSNITNIGNAFRFKYSCLIVVVSINQKDHLLDKIPRYIGVNHNRDLFMFHTAQIQKIATNSLRWKYSIILRLNNATQTVQHFSTMCLYCAGTGESELIKYLPSSNSVSRKVVRNCNGNSLIFSTYMFPSDVIELEKKPATEDQFLNLKIISGVSKFALEHIQTYLNFSLNVVASIGPDKTSRGKASSVIYDVSNNLADIGNPLTHNLQRDNILSFCVYIFSPSIGFVTNLPSEYYNWQSIFWPLKGNAWYCFLSVAVLTSLALILVTRSVFTGESSVPISETVYFLISKLFEQDARTIGGHVCVRLICILWIYFQLLIATAYRSKLTTLLTFPVLSLPPTTFQQLASTSPAEYKISMATFYGAGYNYVHTSSSPAIRKILKRLAFDGIHKNCFDKTVRTQNHVCVAYEATIRYYFHKFYMNSRGTVRMLVSKEMANPLQGSFIFPKRSLVKDLFDRGLRQTVAMGFAGYWRVLNTKLVLQGRSNLRTEGPSEDADTGAKPLKWEHVHGIFYICLIVWFVSVLFFVKELVCSKLSTCNVNKLVTIGR